MVRFGLVPCSSPSIVLSLLTVRVTLKVPTYRWERTQLCGKGQSSPSLQPKLFRDSRPLAYFSLSLISQLVWHERHLLRLPTYRFLGPSPSHSDASPSAMALGTWFSQGPEGFLSQPRLGSFYTACSWNTDETSCPRLPTPTPRSQRLGLVPIPHRPHPPSPRARPLAGTEHFCHMRAEHLPRVKLGPTCQKQEGMEGQQENGGGNRYS